MSAFQFIAQAQPVVSVPVPPQPHIVQVRNEKWIAHLPRTVFLKEKTTKKHSKPPFFPLRFLRMFQYSLCQSMCQRRPLRYIIGNGNTSQLQKITTSR